MTGRGGVRPDGATVGSDGSGPAGHRLVGCADAGAFLARLVRLDPAALVRLRSVEGPGARTALWARLPWGVLVVRTVAGAGPGDATVRADELLAELARAGTVLPARQDARWRWPLPPPASRLVEALPVAVLRQIATSAAVTLRDAAQHGVGGRAVGQRALRDALLDHVAVVVTPDAGAGPAAERVEVTQRLVQGVVRLGFLGAPEGAPEPHVQVRVAARWVGLAAPYGAAWSQKVVDLVLSPLGDRPNG